MSVKSSTELMLYVVLTMPTLNKAYLFIYLFIYPGFQVRGGALKKIAPSGGRRENFWGISCENSRFYAKKADYRISLLPLTSNSKNKTVVSKLHCMSNL